jgi:hypothetical protein
MCALPEATCCTYSLDRWRGAKESPPHTPLPHFGQFEAAAADLEDSPDWEVVSMTADTGQQQ